VFVCQCTAVTDHDVVEAVDDGATNVGDVGYFTGAGTGCGGCHESIQAILDRHRAEAPRVALAVA
jgi:bacterioferritin-associated ferredoxin